MLTNGPPRVVGVPDSPASSVGASPPPTLPAGCFLTSSLCQTDGVEMRPQSWFQFAFLLLRGQPGIFSQCMGQLNSIFLWRLHVSFVLFPVRHCLPLVDLSETLTSSSTRDLFSASIGPFWVLLWFLPQDHPSLITRLTFLSFISYHLLCVCSFLLRLGELLELILEGCF